jgi:hypothetical protein
VQFGNPEPFLNSADVVQVQHLLRPRSVYRDPALVQRVLAKIAEA